MNKTTYEDYKYCIQDVTKLYIGSKYNFGELLDAEAVPFKLKLVMRQYVMPEADLEDTLETHFYYLDPKSFLVQIYGQLSLKVKINLLTKKKTTGGNIRQEYTTKVLSIKDLTAMSVEEKEKAGVVIQEIIISKLALMGF